MHRRSFLSSLAAFAATAALDPEKLLWRAGEKTIFIPPKPSVSTSLQLTAAFSVGDIITFGGRFAMNPKTRQSTGLLQHYIVTAVNTEGAPTVAPIRHLS